MKTNRQGIWYDSIPTWTQGARSANPKFQAGIKLWGIDKVTDRMDAISGLSRRLVRRGVIDKPLLTSHHILHEVQTSNPRYRNFNSPNAVGLKALKAGIKSGRFPRVLAMTAPAFGFRGSERGAILSKRSSDVRMARDLHREAIEVAQELFHAGLGEGVVIWWPAFTARLMNDGGKPLPFREAKKRLVEFFVDLITETGWPIYLEWKPQDPGVDYLCTLKLAIEFCNEVNRILGWKGLFINNEWAHLLIGGTTVLDGTRRTIRVRLFNRFVHGNSAQILPASLEDVIGDDPDSATEFAAGTDWDWAVGIGGSKRWDDQQKAVGELDKWSAASGKPILFEHDINPSGLDGIKYAELSITNRAKMLRAVRCG